jgi:hypothetical protein
MQISQVDTQVLTTLFGDEVVGKLSGALSDTDGELSLGLRLNGKVLTEDQQKELRESGVQQGKQISSKEMAKLLGVELGEGEKDPKVVAEKLKGTLQSQLEEKYKNQTPTDELLAAAKKATEWEGKYKKLFETHEQLGKTAKEWEQKYAQKEKDIANEALNNKILQHLPEKLRIDKSDALIVMRSALSFDKNESGQTVIKKGDKEYLNPVGEPESLENVVKLFSEEKKWLKGNGGMGGDNRNPSNTPSGYTPENARKYIIEKGIAPTSAEGLKLYAELTKK